MRVATQQDSDAIEAFLLTHLESSLFLISNLRRYGVEGGTDPKALRFWLVGENAIEGLVALSASGTVLPQWPGMDAQHIVETLKGAHITALLGEGGQVATLRDAFAFPDAPYVDEPETLFTLNLDGFTYAAPDGFSITLLGAYRDLAIDWREAYHEEAFGTPEHQRRERAQSDIDSYIREDTHRILLNDGAPLAMTGFNAVLPEAVQIGGVYTPPEHRGHHFARHAIGLHLNETQANRAILFATSDNAIRVYESLGFKPIGTFGLALYETPQVVA